MSLFSKFFVKRKKLESLVVAKDKVTKLFQVNLDIQRYYAAQSSIFDHKHGCEIILFSKDRAMQLHALLSSYFYFVTNPAPIHILYTCSSAQHQESYDDVIRIFSNENVNFVKETHFRSQLITLISDIKTSKMFFMTDDALFIDYLDLEDFTKFDTRNAVPTLSKGNDLTYCFAFDRMQSLPTFLPVNGLEENKLAWKWSSSTESPDWAYPLSVDGTLFTTYEILEIIKSIDFKAPNSLESNLQEFLPLFMYRYGICYEKVKYVNVPCNIVQKEWINHNTNAMDVEFLLQKWNEGKRIHFEELKGADVKVVQKAIYSFVDRAEHD